MTRKRCIKKCRGLLAETHKALGMKAADRRLRPENLVGRGEHFASYDEMWKWFRETFSL